MIINQANLTAMYTSFNSIFNEFYQKVEPTWQKVAMKAPSTGKRNTYAWLGDFPRMREWLGERHIKNLETHDYTILNRTFELTCEVPREDIEDDEIGVFNPIVARMGEATAEHPDELIFSLFSDGLTTNSYDGVPFFSTTHPVGTGTVSNNGAGAGTAWYLLDTSRSIKPYILQMRREPQFVYFDNPNDEHVFMNKSFLYGSDYRANAGYGLWQLAYTSKQTLDGDAYGDARAAMMSFLDDFGKPLNIKPNLLVVPPALEQEAREILMNERDAAGATNPWRGSAEMLVSAWLA